MFTKYKILILYAKLPCEFFPDVNHCNRSNIKLVSELINKLF